jgi:hypothetical protein
VRVIGTEEQVGGGIEDEAQFRPGTTHVVAAQRMLGVTEVAHVAAADAFDDRQAAHDPIAHQRTADARVGAECVEVTADDGRRGFHRARRPLRNQIERAAHGIAAVERPLGAAQDLDPFEVDEIVEHHHRTCEIDAVEVDGRARVGTGEHHVRPDAANGELSQITVLGEGHRWSPACELGNSVRVDAPELFAGDHADGERRRLDVALAGLRGRDEHMLGDAHRERE